MATSNLARTLYQRVAIPLLAPSRIEPANITATGGGTTSIVSTSANFNKTAASAYNGLYATVTYDAGGSAAAPEGECHVVTAFNGSTTLTAGTYSAVIASGDLVSLTPLSSVQMFDCMNEIIRNLPLSRYLPVTLVADGDMENANATVTTDWADVTGTPTQTKETSIVLTGTQSLKVVYTVVDTSVGSANIPVTEGDVLSVWAPVKCTAGSLRVQVYDVTNGAEIDGVTTDEEAWTVVWMPSVTIPAGCQNVAVRLVNKTAATTAYIDHVGVLSQNQRLYNLPSQVTDVSLLDGLSVLRLGQASEAADSYMWTGDFDPFPHSGRRADSLAVNARALEIPRSSWPLFYEFRATNTALSAMSSTFYCSSDMFEAIVEGATGECFKRMGETGLYALHRRNYQGMLRSLGIAPKVEQPRLAKVMARGR